MKRILTAILILATFTSNAQYTGTYFRATKWMSSPNITVDSIKVNGVWYKTFTASYPGAGIAISTGTGWGTSITNNSSNWNTAYTYRLTSATGTSPLKLTLSSNALTGTIDSANTTRPGYYSKYNYEKLSNVSVNARSKTVKIGRSVGTSETETSLRGNVLIGYDVANSATSIDQNTIIGYEAGKSLTIGDYNTLLGYGSGYSLEGTTAGLGSKGSGNTMIGTGSGRFNKYGRLNILLGTYAGRYGNNDSMLIVDSRIRADSAAQTTSSILYGKISSQPSLQWLNINGSIRQNGELRDTANSSHSGFLTKYQYNKLQNSGSKWTLNGSDIYRMSRVGIGVTTPLTNLHIYSASGDPIIRLEESVNNYYWNIYNRLDDGDFIVESESGNYFTMLHGGHFGINKTPSYPLDVNGSINGTSYYLNGVLKSNQFHDSLTIGTSNGLTRTGKQVLNLGLSSTSTTGALSNTDWNTFNGKIGGSGTANYVSKFTGTGTIGNSIIQDDGEHLGFGTAPNSSYIARFGSGDVLFGGAIKGITYGTASNYWQALQTSTTASVATGFLASVSSNATPTVPERSSPALVMLARAYKTSDLSSQPNTMIVRVRGISGTTTSGALTIENSYVDGVANSNEVARFTTGGYLGIGITSPQNMLHINDGANATYTQITNTATGSTATDGSKIGIESDGDLAIVQQENDSIKLFTNSTLAASINGSGYLSYKGSFAEIYCADASAAQTIPTGTTYTKLTHWTTNGESSNCTADAANDKITITKKGRYKIEAYSSSFINIGAVTFRYALFAGGVEISKIHSWRKYANANDKGAGAIGGIYYASSVPVDLDIRVRHDNGGGVDLTLNYANFSVTYIGE